MRKRKKKENALIVKIAALGDVCMATPILEELEKQGFSVTWVVGKSSVILLKSLAPQISLIIVDEKKLLEGSFLQKATQLLSCYKKLFFRSFDLIATLHKDQRYRLISLFCFSRKRSFFSKDDPFPTGGVFHTHRYIELIFNKKPPIPLTWKNITPSMPINLIAPLSNTKRIALNLGGDYKSPSKSLRIYPPSFFARVAKFLLTKGYEVILLGEAKDIPYVEKPFTALLNEHNSITSYLGKTTLQELLCLLNSVNLCITHDSGVLHLSRFAKCKTLALFGPTSPFDFSYPGKEEAFIYRGNKMSCSPCYLGKTYALCSHKNCLRAISAQDVYDKTLELLL